MSTESDDEHGTPIVVLIADDQAALRNLVRATISSDRFRVIEAADGDEAWTLLLRERPSVAILDVNMPRRSGLDVARAVRGEPDLAGTWLILLTGNAGRDAAQKGLLSGADVYLTKPFSPRELLEAVERSRRSDEAQPIESTSAPAGPEFAVPAQSLSEPLNGVLRFLDLLDDERLLLDIDALRRQIAMARGSTLKVSQRLSELEGERQAREQAEAQQLRAVRDFRETYDRVLGMAERLDRAYLETITTLARAIEARDGYTGGHVERVRRYSLVIAATLGISGDALRQLEFGAVLHDVGKIGVPDAVLRKSGPLDAEEWRAMRQHPEIGRRLLEGIAFLAPAIAAVTHHHERWDGKGYPTGLEGEGIPLEGRIVAVADSFDAMASDRPYRQGLPEEIALEEIARGSGTQFDPSVAHAFLESRAART